LKSISVYCSLIGVFFASITVAKGQMITGVWKGKINNQRAEVKIIQNGDSLAGTSYYYESPSQYRRYSIKGYFDPSTNEAVWWDDQLVETNPARSTLPPGKIAQLARADFNCPGDGTMMLDGKAGTPDEQNPKGGLHLDKTNITLFPDEWDFVLENYVTGANDPWIIDSISTLSFRQPEIPLPTLRQPAPKKEIIKENENPVPTLSNQTTEQKFHSRKKVFVTEIPLKGDSIELRFYDNAEIDGDSISLFLNGQLIFQHIRLLGSAYTIKLAVGQLDDTNELTMVAENLGSIPPNTSYMVAVVDDKRYEAFLQSTEGSSASVRLVKPASKR
jgi:hypothetical protein